MLTELDVVQRDVCQDAGDDDGAEGEVDADGGDVGDGQVVPVHVLRRLHLESVFFKRTRVLDDTFHHQPNGGDKLKRRLKAAHDDGEDLMMAMVIMRMMMMVKTKARFSLLWNASGSILV